MRIPKFWEREEAGGGRAQCAWGWSDESPEEARQRARQRLQRIEAALDAGRHPDRYAYTADPIRELEIERFGEGPEPFAVVTRNGYGALVLNTRSVAFVDIDLEPEPEPAVGFFKALFGGGGAKADDGEAKRAARRTAEEKASRLGVTSLRIYETPAGLRLLLTDALRDPASDETQQLLRGFDSDPLYRRLCKAQACFRARLTAKPWRIGMQAPHPRYPGREPAPQYLDWCKRYEKAASGTSACAHVASIGTPPSDPEIQRVVEIHDAQSGASRGRTLA